MFNSYRSNTLQYAPNLCVGCGMCYTVCPQGVFAPDGRVAQLVNLEACIECGACQLNCPADAIHVDSGVGCAAAMIRAALSGQKEATCGGGSERACCGSGQDAESRTWLSPQRVEESPLRA